MPDPTGDITKLSYVVGGAIDEITKKLDTLKGKYADTFSSSSGPAASMAKYNAVAAASTETTKKMTAQTSAMTTVFKGLQETLLGPAGVAYGFYQVGKALNTFAESRVRLQNLSTDIGFTTEKIDLMERTMARMGRSADEARQIYSQFGLAVKEMGALKEGSAFFQFWRDTGEAAFGEELIKHAKNVGEVWDMTLKHLKAGSDEYKDYAAAHLGIPRSVIDSYGEFEKTTQKGFEASYQHSQKYIDNLQKIETRIGNIIAKTAEWSVNIIGAGMDEPKLNPLIRDEIYRKGIATSMVKYGQSAYGADYGPTGVSGAELPEIAKSSNEYLKSMRDSLKAMERFFGFGGDGGDPTHGWGGGGGGAPTFRPGVGPGQGGRVGPGTPGQGPYKVGKGGDPRGMEAYIREAAKREGVDPDTAVRVAASEGLGSFTGDRGTSFGSFQLHTGGGLGDEFQRETGLNPADPANEKATIDWAMKKVKTTGWGPWHGAARVGVGPREGLGDSTGYVGAPGNRTVTGGGAAAGDSGVMRGVNPRLLAAAEGGAGYLPPGYTLRPTSGVRTGSGQSYHHSGQASDWEIVTPDGKVLSNRGADPTGLYRQWAAGAKTWAHEHDPSLEPRLGWGGAFETSRGSRTRDLMHLDLGGPRGNLDPSSRLSNLPYLKKDEKGDTRKEVPHPEPEIAHTTPGYSFYSGRSSYDYEDTLGGRQLRDETLHSMHPYPGFRHAPIGDRRLEPRFDPAWGTPEENAFHPAQMWFRGDPRKGYGYRRALTPLGAELGGTTLDEELAKHPRPTFSHVGPDELISPADRSRFDKTQSHNGEATAVRHDLDVDVDFKNIPAWVKTSIAGGKFNRLKVTRSTAGGGRSEEPTGSTDANRWSY